MNKASELFAALEQDQEKALERFYKEWDEICNNDAYEQVTTNVSIRLSIKGRPAVCLCPIIAVYLQRYGLLKSNGEYQYVAYELDLSFHDTNQIVRASDGWIPEGLSASYRVRLLKPFNATQ